MLTIALLLCLLSIPIIKMILEIYRFNQNLKYVPGPPPRFLVGNTLDFPDLESIIPNFMKFHQTYGPTIKFTFKPRKELWTMSYDLVELILSSSVHLSKASEYKAFDKWLGNGLLLNTGTNWKKMRRLLNPSFNLSILEQYLDTINNKIDELIEAIDREKDKEYIDIHPILSHYALDVICETAMGMKINALSAKGSKYTDSFEEICNIVMIKSYNPLLLFDFYYQFTKLYRREKEALKVLHGLTDMAIQHKKKALAMKKKDDERDEDGFGIRKNKAFLDLLLESTIEGQPLSDFAIRSEIDTFMFGGHHTVSTAMAFVFYTLGKYPEYQKKVYEEQKMIYGEDYRRNPTLVELNKMKYMEMVIKETMRLFPPVPIFARRIAEDVKFAGIILPKGMAINIFVYGLHRDPSLYPNPEVFDPERFSEKNNIKKPFAYIPFSAGPRNCIGQKFGMMEMKATLSRIIRTFFVQLASNYEPILTYEAVLRCINGVNVKLERRTS